MQSSAMSDEAVSRRGFFRATGAGAAALSLSMAAATGSTKAPGPSARRCLLISLIGGPSQLDTWDPKPEAPEEIRGPFRAIRTTVPGVCFTECFPRLSRFAHRLTVVRTVHHADLAVHEAGLQILHSGGVHRHGEHRPSIGAVFSYTCHSRTGKYEPWYLLPGPLESLGLQVSSGQDAGALGSLYEPVTLLPGSERPRCAVDELRREGLAVLRRAARLDDERPATRERYGATTFGRNCLIARRLLELGARFVVLNMYTGVFNQVSWDCHANGYNLPTTLADYARRACPAFDRAFTALLDDLRVSGLLHETLVVACGELGRHYQVNSKGGRDHWTQTWSALLAGGPVPEGAVWGRTDAYGAFPEEGPVPLEEIAALIRRQLGVPHYNPCFAGRTDQLVHGVA